MGQYGVLTTVWVPDAAHEALRDLVRARATAKQDESRAKHRLVKYLLRYGLRHPESRKAWSTPWWVWVRELEFEHETQRLTLDDYIAEVLHMGERVCRLDLAIDRAVESAPDEKKAVIEALQALRGVAKSSLAFRRADSPAAEELPDVPLPDLDGFMSPKCLHPTITSSDDS